MAGAGARSAGPAGLYFLRFTQKGIITVNEPTQSDKTAIRQAGMNLMRQAGEEANKAAAAALQGMRKPSPEQIRANEEASRRQNS